MGLRIVTPAASNPLPLALVKAHCKIEDTEDDALADFYQSAAVSSRSRFRPLRHR